MGGLQPLGSATRNDDADKRLQAALDKMAALDAEVLGRPLAIRRDARMIVGAPWVALARVRAEFFAGLAAHWGPIATELNLTPSHSALPTASPAAAAPAPLNPPEEPESSAPVFAGTASINPHWT